MQNCLRIVCRFILVLGLAFVVVSCNSLPSPAVGQPILTDFLGICHAGWRTEAAEYEMLARLGVSWTRLDFSWDHVEPVRGQFNFTKMDRIVDEGRAQGLQFLGILDYDADWLNPWPAMKRVVHADQRIMWLAYVRATVLHYKGRVLAWEIWNEPNWTFWHGTVDEFADLTRETGKLIRELDPGATVIAGAFFRTPAAYAATMTARGAFDHVDVVSFHPYSWAAEESAAQAVQMMNLLRVRGFRGRFWVTEIGYPTRGLYPSQVMERDLPGRMIQTITMLSALGVERVFWYNMYGRWRSDEKPVVDNIFTEAEAWFGLLWADNVPTKSADALITIGRVLAGSVWTPEQLDNRVSGLVAYALRMSDGRTALIVWSRLGVGFRTSTALATSGCESLEPVISAPGREFRVEPGRPLILITDSKIGDEKITLVNLYPRKD